MRFLKESKDEFFDSVFIDIVYYWAYFPLLAIFEPSKCITDSFKERLHHYFLTGSQTSDFDGLWYHFAFLTFGATYRVFASYNT